jgi:hypothetical protein
MSLTAATYTMKPMKSFWQNPVDDAVSRWFGERTLITTFAVIVVGNHLNNKR